MNHLIVLFTTLTAIFVSPALGDIISGTASVIDGDTIDIHGQRIRLSAIDAVESHQPCLLADGKRWNCGRDAAFALSNKIGRAPVSCEVEGIDRYGRSVAICVLRGEDINAWMVENGWAVAYRHYGTQYVPAADHAREARLGIWTSQFMMPWDWRKEHR